CPRSRRRSWLRSPGPRWIGSGALSRPDWATSFKNRVTVTPSGCWEGRGAPMRHGYKKISIGGKRDYLHRWAYRLFKGDIPEGYDIDHLCKNRGCGNPDHLEAVDHRTNVLRGNTFVSAQASQTGCRRFGHPLKMKRDGKRYCPTCHNLARRGTSTSQASQ